MAKQKSKTKNKVKGKDIASKKEKKGLLKPFFSIFKDERLHKSFGLLCILFGIYLIVAIISYLFTWKTDQSIVESPLFSVWNGDFEVKNWLGKLGAYAAHKFLKVWFGIASLLIAFYALIVGVRVLFKLKILSLIRGLQIFFITLVWSSLALALLFDNPLDFMGGGFGEQIIAYTNSTIGKIGSYLFVIFTGIISITVLFNPSYDFLKNAISKVKKEKEEFYKEAQLESLESTDEEKLMKGTIQPTPKETVSNTLKPTTSGTSTLTPTTGLELDVTDTNTTNDLPLETEIKVDDPIVEIYTAGTSDKEGETTSEELEVTVPKKEEAVSTKELNAKVKEFGEYDPELDLSSYKLPTIDLLNDYKGAEVSLNKEELEENKNKIIQTLLNYKIEISKIKATIGPTITLYEIVPAAGVRISKIKNLEDDIALSLAALGIRIIAPMPGKGTVGIEVPNRNPKTVSMRSLIASEKFQNSEMELPVALGKTISNESFVADLAKMPHLLMAGATGQGKSVGLNAILVSILYKKHPSQVKFVLVDPKKVELTLFNKIERHFLAKLPDEAEAIITDTQKVVETLNSLCIEMDNRYDLLKNAYVRNIKEYNAKFVSRKLNPENGHKYLPYIVLVIDEFADLIMTAGKEVETPIARLAQLARAIGIHLIVATQRPSVNVITGIIKANFPARLAFRVTSKIDSRTILDAGGADQLIGRGDMLFSPGNELIRLQCGFVDTPEVEEITDYIGSQRGYPDAFLLPEAELGETDGGRELDDTLDSLFEDAAHIIVNAQQGSASNIQRKLKIGYNRAGRIIDQMEATGLIGPHKGSKAREVYMPDILALEQFLQNLREKGLLQI